MVDVISVSEKGQIAILKKIREDFNINKGTKLLITEEKDTILLKRVALNEDHLLMLLSETSLHQTWDNKYDEQWDKVL